MSQLFSMQFEASGDDFFINLSGVFDGSSAWQLADTILTRFHGPGRLFIDARELLTVVPFGADMIVNLVPKSLVMEKNVLIRDRDGTHKGLDHFHTLSQKYIPGQSSRTIFSSASIC